MPTIETLTEAPMRGVGAEALVSCLWGQDDGIWETGCGHAFEFNDGDPADNYFRFCPYCGKPLVVIDYDDVDNSSSLDGSGS